MCEPIQGQQQVEMLDHYTCRCLDLPTYVHVRRFAHVQEYCDRFLIVNNWKATSKMQFPYSWCLCYLDFKNHRLNFQTLWPSAPHIDRLHRGRSISDRRCGAEWERHVQLENHIGAAFALFPDEDCIIYDLFFIFIRTSDYNAIGRLKLVPNHIYYVFIIYIYYIIFVERPKPKD
jgi:hypothetical protein